MKMLESRALLKQEEVKNMIFSILTPVITQNQEALQNIQIKLINLIYDEENIVDNVANFLLNAYKSDNCAL